MEEINEHSATDTLILQNASSSRVEKNKSQHFEDIDKVDNLSDSKQKEE